jgi:hypothetical protein
VIASLTVNVGDLVVVTPGSLRPIVASVPGVLSAGGTSAWRLWVSWLSNSKN